MLRSLWGWGGPQKNEPQPLRAAGVRRRLIEGEGLGGFARRLSVNDSLEGLFRPGKHFGDCAKR